MSPRASLMTCPGNEYRLERRAIFFRLDHSRGCSGPGIASLIFMQINAVQNNVLHTGTFNQALAKPVFDSFFDICFPRDGRLSYLPPEWFDQVFWRFHLQRCWETNPEAI